MIEEPVTTITDYLLAVETSILGILLFQNSEQLSGKVWSAAFIAFAAGALLGGTFHGFRSSLPAGLRLFFWRGTAIFLMTGVFLMVCGGIMAVPKIALRNVLIGLLATGWLVFFIHLSHKQQQAVEVSHGFSLMILLVVVLCCLLSYWLLTGKSATGGWILLGSIICLGAVAVQQSGFSLHRYLNQNDLSHILFMIGLFLLYRGFSLSQRPT